MGSQHLWAAWVSIIRRCGSLILERAAKSGSQHLWAAWVSIIRRCGSLILERAAKLGSQHLWAAWVSIIRRCGSLIIERAAKSGSQHFLGVYHQCQYYVKWTQDFVLSLIYIENIVLCCVFDSI